MWDFEMMVFREDPKGIKRQKQKKRRFGLKI